MVRKTQTAVTMSAKVNEVQGFVLGQLEDARRRIQTIERELVSRGRAQQREIESLLKRVRSGKELKALEKAVEKRATATAHDARKALDQLQGQVLTALGIASHSEIAQIAKELAKLSKKVDQLVKRPAAQA